jgi:hypothetical protein
MTCLEHYKNITSKIGTLGNCDIMSAIPLPKAMRGIKFWCVSYAVGLSVALGFPVVRKKMTVL